MSRWSAALPFLLWLVSHGGDADAFQPGVRLSTASFPPVRAAADGPEGYGDGGGSDVNDALAGIDTYAGGADAASASTTTLEERISADVASTASSTMGRTFGRSYEASRDTLRISRSRTQRKLDRSARAKDRAAKKIAALRQKFEEEVERVEKELRGKLEETQESIQEEVEVMSNLLQEEILLERAREIQLSNLVTMLKSSIDAKKADIKREEEIAAEMVEVRSKLEPGTIASQLDAVIEQKRRVADVENNFMSDLTECLDEVTSVLADCRARMARFEDVLAGIVPPVAAKAGDTRYDWSDIDGMDAVLERAAASAIDSNRKIRDLQMRLEGALVQKSAVLGTYGDLTEKGSGAVAGVLAKSLGQAALSGSKAAVFGIKAVIDTVSERDGGSGADANGTENVK